MNLIKIDLQKKKLYKHVSNTMYEIQLFTCSIHSLIRVGNLEKKNIDKKGQPLIAKHNPQEQIYASLPIHN